jgi:hypothetical protein
MRFLTPGLFLAATIYVAWYNQSHIDRTLVLPGMDALAGADPVAQGEATVYALGGLTVAFAAWDLFVWLRNRSQE